MVLFLSERTKMIFRTCKNYKAIKFSGPSTRLRDNDKVMPPSMTDSIKYFLETSLFLKK